MDGERRKEIVMTTLRLLAESTVKNAEEALKQSTVEGMIRTALPGVVGASCWSAFKDASAGMSKAWKHRRTCDLRDVLRARAGAETRWRLVVSKE